MIPGHLPMNAKFYRNDYTNPTEVLFTGPPIASIGGASYNCTSIYDDSCNVAPPNYNPCTISYQRCMSATTYQACAIGYNTTVWGPEQSCQTGLVCAPNPDGEHIMCTFPSQVPTPVPVPIPSPSPAVLSTGRILAPSTTGMNSPTPALTPGTSTTGYQVSGSSSCASGNMKCLSSNTYSICDRGVWDSAQSCGTGLSCSPSGNYIYCIPSGVTPSPPANPSTSTSTSTSTVVNGCTASSFGNQRCNGQNSYQTCITGQNGPVWSSAQQCQTGLSCHTQGNNIYCY